MSRGDPPGAQFYFYPIAHDDAKSFLGELSRIVLIWAGDSEYVCNWVGTKRIADAVNWPRKKEFARKRLELYTVQGVQKATSKTVKNLHYARAFNAVQNVWWYQPETSLQTMTQFLSGEGLFSS